MQAPLLRCALLQRVKGTFNKPDKLQNLMNMKKEKIIPWIVIIIMIFIIPYFIVRIADNEQDIMKLFSWQVLIIIPLLVIGLKLYKRKIRDEK